VNVIVMVPSAWKVHVPEMEVLGASVLNVNPVDSRNHTFRRD
jgi:hypothetical protein